MRRRTRRSDEAVLRRGRSGLPGFGRPLLWSEKSLFVLAVRKNYISVFVFRNTDTQAVGKDIFENCAGL